MANAQFLSLVRRSATPAAAYVTLHFDNIRKQSLVECEKLDERVHDSIGAKVNEPKLQAALETNAPKATLQRLEVPATVSPPLSSQQPSAESGENSTDGKSALFHGLFPKRQLWRPKVEYPLWDYDWDNRREEETGDDVKDRERSKFVRKNGVTRHIILIRHGQYDERHKEDEKRILTPLGRKQAELTGKRLAEMIRGIDENFDPCAVKVIRVSGMARAKETADIISSQLDSYSETNTVERSDPDPLLNEGRPCHHIPGGKASSTVIQKTDDNHERIEKAFKKYFYRSDPPFPDSKDEKIEDMEKESEFESDSSRNLDSTEKQLKSNPKHEFEIIVCHANVIRYFLCRALQLPPEAWLRLCVFNCSLTYLTIRPTGTVSCRMLGDIGHLGYDHSTFSMHHGFNW